MSFCKKAEDVCQFKLKKVCGRDLLINSVHRVVVQTTKLQPVQYSVVKERTSRDPFGDMVVDCLCHSGFDAIVTRICANTIYLDMKKKTRNADLTALRVFTSGYVHSHNTGDRGRTDTPSTGTGF